MPTRNATADVAGWAGQWQRHLPRADRASAAGTASTRASAIPSGSNPEELLAAAEAACYSMALSLGLEKEGFPPTKVETQAACTVEKVGEGFKITRMQLVVRATVPEHRRREVPGHRRGHEGRLPGVSRVERERADRP